MILVLNGAFIADFWMSELPSVMFELLFLFWFFFSFAVLENNGIVLKAIVLKAMLLEGRTNLHGIHLFYN